MYEKLYLMLAEKVSAVNITVPKLKKYELLFIEIWRGEDLEGLKLR